eukprot:SAG11_NODE_4548_length_1856_cov_0.774616_1_plen_105_part_00
MRRGTKSAVQWWERQGGGESKPQSIYVQGGRENYETESFLQTILNILELETGAVPHTGASVHWPCCRPGPFTTSVVGVAEWHHDGHPPTVQITLWRIRTQAQPA